MSKKTKISLTDFVDIVSKAGTSKANKVRQVKERPEYVPAFDFYKQLREHIIDVHTSGKSRSDLDSVLESVHDPKKGKNYPELLVGYKKWWGRKSMEWFAPPKEVYSMTDVEVIINPELGLKINGEQHVIKMYFKSESLAALRVQIIADLMEHSLRSLVSKGTIFSILDVRNSKLHSLSKKKTNSLPLINAEIAYISSIWNS